MTSVSESSVGKSFLLRSVAAFGVNIVSAAVTFGLHVLLARVMGPAFYGTYIYVITWVMVLALIPKLGFDTALVRFLPAFVENDDWGKVRLILRRSFQLCFIVGLAVMVILAIVTWALPESTTPHLISSFYIGALIIPTLGLVHLIQAALRGLKNVPRNELPDRVIRPVLMIVAVGGFMMLQRQVFHAEFILSVHLITLLIGGILAAVWLRNAMPSESIDAPRVFETRQWLNTAIPLAVFSAMHMLLSHIDVLMVGSLAGTQEAGIYAVASRMAVFTIFALTAVNSIAAPVISELYERGDHRRLQIMLSKYARINVAFSVLATGIFYVLGEFTLGWFGSPFSTAFAALIILCGGHIANATAGSVGFLLTMTGHEKPALVILVFTVISNVAMNAWMIPAWGITGAAIATALSTVIWNAAMWGYAFRKLGINTAAIPAFR